MPRDSLFPRGWSRRGSFGVEPLDVYRTKQRENSKELLESAIARARQVTTSIAYDLPEIPGHNAEPKKQGRFGKLKSGLDKVTPEFVEDAAKTTGKGVGKVIDAPLQYVGAPIMGITSGRIGAEEQSYVDESGKRVTYRAGSPSWGDFRRGIKDVLSQDPLQTYRESREAFNQGQRDPNLPAWKKVATSALSDPLTYVGAGAVKGALRAAPAAVQASKGARIAGAVLEAPRMATAGSIAGAAVGAQAAESAGAPEWMQATAQVAGGVIGGRLASGGIRAPMSALSEEQARGAGKNWRPKIDASDPHEVLGLDPKKVYTAEELKKAYRARLREFHPDINYSDTATEDAAKINAAFQRLSDSADEARDTASQAKPKGAPAAAPAATARGRRRRGTTAVTLTGSSENLPATGFQAAPKPRKDLFNTIPADARAAEEEAFRGTLRGKLEVGAKQVAGKVASSIDPKLKSNARESSIWKERDRVVNMINSYEGYADELWGKVEDAGIRLSRDDDGNFRMMGLDTGDGQDIIVAGKKGISFEDMVELSTPEGRAAYASLNQKQRDAIDALVEWNDELNANLRFHGEHDLGWDNRTGNYFPRMVKSIDGTERPVETMQVGQKLGAQQGYEKPRSYTTFEEGAAAGVNYANPREAFRVMTRAKLRTAQDDFIAKAIKPMGIKRSQIPEGSRWVWEAIPDAPALNGYVFKREDALKIKAALHGGKVQGPIETVVKNANAVLTPMRAMGDVSAFGQQGAALLFRHPDKAVKAAAKVLASTRNDKHYRSLIDAEQSGGPGIKTLVEKMGLHWVPGELEDATEGAAKITRIPVLKQTASFSNKTFGRYMNYVRLVFANDAYERLAKSGLDDAKLRKELMAAGNAVNRISGFTGRRPTSIESISLFAPRYFSASVEQLSAALSRGGIEGSLARRHMARMLAGGAVLAYAINKANGKDTTFDPRSNNFLRIRDVGGLDVSLLGTYDTLFRAVAGTLAGEPGGGWSGVGSPGHTPDLGRLWKLAEGKMSPALQMAYYPFIKHATYAGEPLKFNSPEAVLKTAWEQGKSSMPFGLQNIVDEGVETAIEERDPKKLLDVLPGTAASFVGATNNAVTPTEKRNFRRDDVAKERFGKKYDDLTGAQKSMVNEDEKVAAHQEDADRNTLTRADDKAAIKGVQLEKKAEVEALTKSFKSGKVAGSKFRDTYDTIQAELRGASGVTGRRKSDPELDGWFKLYDEATGPDSIVDREKLQKLQDAYVAKHPDVLERVDAVTGTQDNAVMRQFREARKQAAEYYQLPAYEGMTAEDGEVAREALSLARRMTSNGQAPTVAVALATLVRSGEITTEARRLATIASKRGTSRARKKYLAEHSEFALFYRDAVQGVEGVAEPGTYGDAASGNDGGIPKLPRLSLDLPELPALSKANRLQL